MCGARSAVTLTEPVVVLMPDEIDIANAEAAYADLTVALSAGSPVIADLTGTSFFGAAGAGLLVRTQHMAVAAGCDLRIASSAPVRRVLKLTSLDRVLAVYPTLASARAGAPGPPRPPA